MANQSPADVLFSGWHDSEFQEPTTTNNVSLIKWWDLEKIPNTAKEYYFIMNRITTE